MNKIWIGSPTDVRYKKDATAALATTNDSKYWDDENGIITVDHDRWKKAQQFESTGWLTQWRDANSDRNDEHKRGFNNYDSVPKDLGDVIEIGCGPFTQLKTIQQNRTIKSVTLLDPLLDKYCQLPNCTYKDNHFMNLPTTLICCQAEQLRPIGKFDAAICINVLEHVQDVPKVLIALHQCLRPKGILIFGERVYDGLNIKDVYDIGHPIRMKEIVVTNFLQQFQKLFINTPKHEWGLTYHFIGRVRV